MQHLYLQSVSKLATRDSLSARKFSKLVIRERLCPRNLKILRFRHTAKLFVREIVTKREAWLNFTDKRKKSYFLSNKVATNLTMKHL